MSEHRHVHMHACVYVSIHTCTHAYIHTLTRAHNNNIDVTDVYLFVYDFPVHDCCFAHHFVGLSGSLADLAHGEHANKEDEY